MRQGVVLVIAVGVSGSAVLVIIEHAVDLAERLVSRVTGRLKTVLVRVLLQDELAVITASKSNVGSISRSFTNRHVIYTEASILCEVIIAGVVVVVAILLVLKGAVFVIL